VAPGHGGGGDGQGGEDDEELHSSVVRTETEDIGFLAFILEILSLPIQI
jgi:hypothetical protein